MFRVIVDDDVEKVNRKIGDAIRNGCVNYKLLEKIGYGVAGDVYKIKSSSDNIYALKIIPKNNLFRSYGKINKSKVERVEREIEIHGKLNHPNIVKLYWPFQDYNAIYLKLELMPYSLDKLIKTEYINENDSVIIITSVTKALLFLKGNLIIHCDIKPGNILINNNGDVKICDFGLSEVLPDKNSRVPRFCGTPNYISPELLTSTISFETDIWSLGSVFYLLLFGKCPFQRSDVKQTYRAIKNDPLFIPEISNLKIREVLVGMLNKNPLERISHETVLSYLNSYSS